MTVKEISSITDISIRTLHYYDEIGLLVPTSKSDAGYRLYDEKALEVLQQILFFREFDISLQEIKEVLQNPTFNRNQILQMERGMLKKKKKHIERLINSIDNLLKGDYQMDFEVFTKSDIEELAEATIDHMFESILQETIKEFGNKEAWK
ncbi:MerR family transcriptional regulator [Cellulosilyticum ruminicola]|uniref:MerR family transcriptional regulator n=1 Tax=Cellulosilyticum ruminicola TaxID=425254 RepID=UPI0006D1437F|nr:MerR family transcriptional regulator [Cellulosilyticum ruminicola]